MSSQHQSRAEVTIERDTSNLIIGIANVFNSGQSYETMMMQALEMISNVLHPDRLLLFERGETTTRCTFEWHDERVPPQIERMQNISNEQFDEMGKLAQAGNAAKPVIMSNVAQVKAIDEEMAQRFNRRGIENMMAVPLLDHGRIIGSLSANNYRVEESYDVKRLLETIAPFICTRMINERLVTQLEKLGTHDSLTSLLNRRGVDEAIAERMSQHPDEPYSLALMDIDDFKIVNDLHGHDMGDSALKACAETLRKTFPPDAILGRNGGDEFLAMLFGDDCGNMGKLLEQFASSKLAFEHDGKNYELSLSVGYADYPSQAASLQDAYTKADAALYAVKLAGKTGCKKYAPEHESQYRSQLGFTPRDIAENIPCGITVCKISEVGEILFANKVLVDMLECDDFTDFMTFVGGCFRNILHPDDRDRIMSEIVRQHESAVSGGKTYTDYRAVTKKGNVKRISDSSRTVIIEDVGAVAYVLMVDMEERAFIQHVD